MGENISVGIEAQLAEVDARVGELLTLWKERSDGQDRLGREIVEERAKNLELSRKLVPVEEALLTAQDKIAELQRDLDAAVRANEDAQVRGVALEQDLATARGRIVELERDLAAERARIKELEQAVRTAEQAQARVVALETHLADVRGDLAEHENLVEDLRQALHNERELRKLRETERDRFRQLLGYLQKSRWRRFGQAIGVVKTREWEREISQD
ncbi:MAG TPA: hypothetical protein VF744_11535 [Beijerinckiaceae bacterium]|jgi:chromosome segregation ATPase